MKKSKPNSIKLFLYTLLLAIYFLNIYPTHFYVHGWEKAKEIKECKVCEWQQQNQFSFDAPQLYRFDFEEIFVQDTFVQSFFCTKKYDSQSFTQNYDRGPPMI